MKFYAVIISATLASRLATAAMASTDHILYSFPQGYMPEARLLLSTDGSLVGTNYRGPGAGSVFRMVEKRGKWSEHTVYKFGSNKDDGSGPKTGVVQDANGIYYGTTYYGGTYGAGTVYSLTPNGAKWTEKVLYNFTGGSDGSSPVGELLYDSATGNYYGTTSQAGTQNCGTAFALTQSNGIWELSTLWSFGGTGDGCSPNRALHTGAKNGSLIGITTSGGTTGYGTVYQLTQKSGIWSEKVLHSFAYTDGAYPTDIDVDTTNDMVYGITLSGSDDGGSFGLMYSLNLKGSPKETVLYKFGGYFDGSFPLGMILDKSSGNLYGVTQEGGKFQTGTAFEFTRNGNNWNKSLLHNFGGKGDGSYPDSRPVIDKMTGMLYGTTVRSHAGGTVWTLKP